MKHAALPTLVLTGLLGALGWTPAVRVAPAEPTAAVHCQVPCGIYGDRMRIDLVMEDLATIEKGMAQIAALEDMAAAGTRNQVVRWVMTKDEHAQKVQDQVSAYWLAQRIKTPKEPKGEALELYHRQLELLHRILVAAMLCKQTTDAAHVAEARRLALDFSASYFSAEDLEHIRSHHGPEAR
jgi:nickel superoxide dismutase